MIKSYPISELDGKTMKITIEYKHGWAIVYATDVISEKTYILFSEDLEADSGVA